MYTDRILMFKMESSSCYRLENCILKMFDLRMALKNTGEITLKQISNKDKKDEGIERR
jgi:hypothetical protein